MLRRNRTYPGNRREGCAVPKEARSLLDEISKSIEGLKNEFISEMEGMEFEVWTSWARSRHRLRSPLWPSG